MGEQSVTWYDRNTEMESLDAVQAALVVTALHFHTGSKSMAGVAGPVLNWSCWKCSCPKYRCPDTESSAGVNRCKWCGHSDHEHQKMHFPSASNLLNLQTRIDDYIHGTGKVWPSFDCDITTLQQLGEVPVTKRAHVSPGIAYALLLWVSNPSKKYLLLRRWTALMQMLDPVTNRSFQSLLHEVLLTFPSESYLLQRQWSLDACHTMVRESAAAARLCAVFNTPLPMCYSYKYHPSHDPTPVVPVLNCFPSRVAQWTPAGAAVWLSRDSMYKILEGLDLGSILRVRQVSQEWRQLVTDDSPVWLRLLRRVCLSPTMDQKKTVGRAVSSLRICSRVRFERALFAWLSKNLDSYPTTGKNYTVMKLLWDRGVIPRSMVTVTVMDKLKLGLSLSKPFPPIHFIEVNGTACGKKRKWPPTAVAQTGASS